MNNILAIVEWIKTNWGQIVAGYLALVGFASIIVKLTPTLKDDNVLLAIVKFIGKWIAVDKYAPSDADRPK